MGRRPVSRELSALRSTGGTRYSALLLLFLFLLLLLLLLLLVLRLLLYNKVSAFNSRKFLAATKTKAGQVEKRHADEQSEISQVTLARGLTHAWSRTQAAERATTLTSYTPLSD